MGSPEVWVPLMRLGLQLALILGSLGPGQLRFSSGALVPLVSMLPS